ncbi:MAG: hypothetical protein LBP62_01050 [Clostridiales bacterium]|nr:hypothetical protein [Clostridiales bacterium]
MKSISVLFKTPKSPLAFQFLIRYSPPWEGARGWGEVLLFSLFSLFSACLPFSIRSYPLSFYSVAPPLNPLPRRGISYIHAF